MNPRPSPLRRRIVFCAATGLSLSLPSCGLWTDKPVAVAAHVWVGYEPMFLAQSRGWLDPLRVTLLSTSNSQASIDALRSGQVQAAALTLDEVLSIRDAALPLSIILVFNASIGADMLLAAPNIGALSELKGRRIGLEQSSVANILLAEILQRAGLREADVTLLRLPVDAHLAAWQRRDVDALITYEPVANQLLAKGMNSLFDTRQVPDTVIDVLAVRKDALDNAHASAWRHLLAGHFRAVDAITRNPQDSAYRMATRLQLPAAGVLRALKGLELPDAGKNHFLMSGDNPPLRKTAKRLLALLHQTSNQADFDDLASLLSSAYLPSEAVLK